MRFIKFSILGLCIINLQLNAQELVVVVNKNNHINALSKREVVDIYMGRYITFPDGSSVKPIDLPAMSELKNRFYLNLVNKSERKINAYWARALFSGRAKPPQSVSSIEEAISYVGNSEYTMAYIPKSKVTNAVKVVYKVNEN